MNLSVVFSGAYEVESVLGKGSFGEVARTRCGRAIKWVKWFNDEDDRFKDREVRALEDCCHPNVVALIDYEYNSGHLYVVMECWVMTLAQRLRGETFSLAQGNWILLHIMRGLAHMHDCGYLHRDLKPANILLNDQRLCLADFGHAAKYPPPRDHAPLPSDPLQSALVYTRWYRPPEVTLMLPYDESADVFSVGCIFAEVVRHALEETPTPLMSESDNCYPLSGARIKEGEHLQTIYKVLGTPTAEERALWVAPANDDPKFAKGRARLLSFADGLPMYARCELGFPEAQTASLYAMLAYAPAARKSAAAMRDWISGV